MQIQRLPGRLFSVFTATIPTGRFIGVFTIKCGKRLFKTRQNSKNRVHRVHGRRKFGEKIFRKNQSLYPFFLQKKSVDTPSTLFFIDFSLFKTIQCTLPTYAKRGKDLCTYALCKGVRWVCRPVLNTQTTRRILYPRSV